MHSIEALTVEARSQGKYVPKNYKSLILPIFVDVYFHIVIHKVTKSLWDMGMTYLTEQKYKIFNNII